MLRAYTSTVSSKQLLQDKRAPKHFRGRVWDRPLFPEYPRLNDRQPRVSPTTFASPSCVNPLNLPADSNL